jgi:hypothetical protein
MFSEVEEFMNEFTMNEKEFLEIFKNNSALNENLKRRHQDW